MNVIIYTTPTCAYCRQAKAWLSQKGIKYVERDVTTDRNAANEMVGRSGQMGVPVVIVDDEVVVGFDRPKLESLLAKASAGKPAPFGISVADAAKMTRKKGLPEVSGAYVGGVKSLSPTDRAGLKEGDIITEIDLKTVNNAQDLENALRGLTYGNRVSIVYQRNNQTLRTEVTI